MSNEAEVPPPVGTVLPVGADSPPITTDKARAALLWGLVPVLLGGVVIVLQNATTIFVGGPVWLYTTCSVLFIILGPVASYIGTFRTPSKLLVPVVIAPTP